MANGQKIGYRRVSTVDQNTERQLDGMTFDRVFEDKASARDANRPALQEMLAYAREGDAVFVHSIDRLARNLTDLRRIVSELTSRGVVVQFVAQNLKFENHGNSTGELMLNMLGAVAEFERALILERQREGIAIAKRAGKYRGRKATLNAEQIAEAKVKLASGVPHARVAREYGVSRQTLYSYLKAVETLGNQAERLFD